MSEFSKLTTDLVTPLLDRHGFKKLGRFGGSATSDFAIYRRGDLEVRVVLAFHPYDHPNIGIQLRVQQGDRVLHEGLYPPEEGGLAVMLQKAAADLAPLVGFKAALHIDELPFVQSILASPGESAPRLVYADWLEERGDRRADYLRGWVADNLERRSAKRRKKKVEALWLNRHWMSLVACSRHREEVDPEREAPPASLSLYASPDGSAASDLHLLHGPCIVCGRTVHMQHWISRLPCEGCGRVLCWECADTGVYGSLPDLSRFVALRRPGPGGRLGTDCCPFCQTTDWMAQHISWAGQTR